MKEYIREDFELTEFDVEDVITTSGIGGGGEGGDSDPFNPSSPGEDYTPIL